MDPHILAHVDTGCPDDRYPKLKIFISELIWDNYQHTTVAQVTMNGITWIVERAS